MKIGNLVLEVTMLRIFLILLAILMFASPVLASDGATIPSWEQFLAYLSQPTGAAAAVGVVLSIMVDNVPIYVAQNKKNKRLIFFGLSFSVPILAATLGALTVSWGWGWDSVFWPAIVAGFMAGGVGTITNLRKYLTGKEL